MEVIEGSWSILCNIGSESPISTRFNVVTDVVYPEHDGECSNTYLVLEMQESGEGYMSQTRDVARSDASHRDGRQLAALSPHQRKGRPKQGIYHNCADGHEHTEVR